eukprot:2787355-Amphidinium_carterae.1
MGSLSIVRDRLSQAFSHDIFFDRLRELDSRPSFRSLSELRRNQKPKITHSFRNNDPAKVLNSWFVLGVRSGA